MAFAPADRDNLVACEGEQIGRDIESGLGPTMNPRRSLPLPNVLIPACAARWRLARPSSPPSLDELITSLMLAS
jgi:hypothetical protein